MKYEIIYILAVMSNRKPTALSVTDDARKTGRFNDSLKDIFLITIKRVFFPHTHV